METITKASSEGISSEKGVALPRHTFRGEHAAIYAKVSGFFTMIPVAAIIFEHEQEKELLASSLEEYITFHMVYTSLNTDISGNNVSEELKQAKEVLDSCRIKWARRFAAIGTKEWSNEDIEMAALRMSGLVEDYDKKTEHQVMSRLELVALFREPLQNMRKAILG